MEQEESHANAVTTAAPDQIQFDNAMSVTVPVQER